MDLHFISSAFRTVWKESARIYSRMSNMYLPSGANLHVNMPRWDVYEFQIKGRFPGCFRTLRPNRDLPDTAYDDNSAPGYRAV
jgi:hypothetical protein